MKRKSIIGPWINVILIMLYKFTLDYIYINWISTIWAYAGLIYSYKSSIQYVVSIAICIVLAYICSFHLFKRGKATDIILSFLILFYFIPGSTLYSFLHNSNEYYSFVILYFALLLGLNEIVKEPHISVGTKGKVNILNIIVIFLCILNVVLSAVYSNFRISFDFSEFYENRFEAREFDMPGIFAYFFNWSRFVLPLSVIYYYLRKKYLMTFVVSFAQVLCFSFNGKKSGVFLFFGAFLVIMIYKDSIMKKIPIFLNVMTGVSFLAIKFVGFSLIGQYIIRRVLFIPSATGYTYFLFFSTHELDYLRASFLRHLGFESPYGSIPRYIGEMYAVSSDLGVNNANTGLCGDAYANFGWFSLLIYPYITIVTLKILSSCFKGLPNIMVFFVSVETMYMFINGAFFKLLLTNGLIVICFVAAKIKRNKYGKAF